MTRDKPLRILHVDDEENQLEFTKLFLEQLEKDIQVESVKDPQEALRLQEQNNYDCIVSDYKMMSMNGIELAQKVREKSDVPFILYTGQGSEEVAEAAFSAGVDDYMRKESEPTHYQVLAKRIKHTVEKHRTDALYRKLVEESRDGILIVVEGRLEFLNKAACAMLGAERVEDCIGKEIEGFFQGCSEELEEVLGGKAGPLVKLGFTNLAGERKVVELNISTINYRGEEGLLCFLRDVTQRETVEERLRAVYLQAVKLGAASSVEEVCEATLDIMEGLYRFDALAFHVVDGGVVRALGVRGSKPWAVETPVEGPGLVAKAAREASTVLENDLPNTPSYIRGITDAQAGLAVPALLEGRVVAVLSVESRNQGFTADDQRLLETLAHQVSYALNKLQVEEMRRREEDARRERLNYALGVLDNAERASTILSEEVQRSLRGILNATDVLRSQPEMLPQVADTIEVKAGEAGKAAERVQTVLNQLMSLEDVVEVNRAITQTLTRMDLPRNVRVKTQFHDGQLLVGLNPDKFMRVVENLVDNAVEAMDGGGTLTVRVSQRGGEALVSVGDTGRGIPPDQWEEVFTPFRSNKEGHSGLGLAYCRNVVKSAGGRSRLKQVGRREPSSRFLYPF